MDLHFCRCLLNMRSRRDFGRNHDFKDHIDVFASLPRLVPSAVREARNSSGVTSMAATTLHTRVVAVVSLTVLRLQFLFFIIVSHP